MLIFASVHIDHDRDKYDKIADCLGRAGHRIYVKHVKGALGAPGLYDMEVLDNFFRDEDLAMPFITDAYLTDTWLVSELHSLYSLQNKCCVQLVSATRDLSKCT